MNHGVIKAVSTGATSVSGNAEKKFSLTLVSKVRTTPDNTAVNVSLFHFLRAQKTKVTWPELAQQGVFKCPQTGLMCERQVKPQHSLWWCYDDQRTTWGDQRKAWAEQSRGATASGGEKLATIAVQSVWTNITQVMLHITSKDRDHTQWRPSLIGREHTVVCNMRHRQHFVVVAKRRFVMFHPFDELNHFSSALTVNSQVLAPVWSLKDATLKILTDRILIYISDMVSPC